MVDLFQLSHAAAHAPFDLQLADAEPLQALHIVRAVPGKRLVCSGLWHGQSVYAKIFFGKAAQRYAARDAAGVGSLLKAGIATPALLHSGFLKEQADAGFGCVLIFAAIVNGANAEEVWQKIAPPERLDLALKLVEEVAKHHNAGLRQTDLYLKNFLVNGGIVYTLDGDAIKPLPVLLANRAAIANLVVLLSKFDVLEIEQWLPILLDRYCQTRAFNTLNVEKIRQHIAVHRRKVVQAYADKKVFRTCTDVECFKNWRTFLALARPFNSQVLKSALIDAPDGLIEGVQQQRLKSGNTCTVSLAEINGRKLVVKRYNIKSFWHGAGRFWRKSRAADSWANAHRLRMYGIATATPVALLEKRFGPMRGKAFFLAEYIQAPSVDQLMQDASVNQAQKISAARALAALMYKLKLLQIAHGDLKASNIHMDDNQPVLIDLDSLQEYQCKTWFAASHVRDLKRLLKNWQDQPQVRQWLVESLQQAYGQHHPLLIKALKD